MTSQWTILEVVSGAAAGATYISFTEEDLALFSEASRDRNPLHLSYEYARSTPYGQPVVFGCLGALACLGRLDLPAGCAATTLEAEFLRPMFMGVQYRVETSEKDGQWRVRLFDGSTPAVSVTVTAEPSPADAAPVESVATQASERQEPITRQPADIVPGLAVAGVYECNAPALAAVIARWGVTDAALATALCWSSYLVGMELPGESALFSKLVLRRHGAEPWPAALSYRATVASVDRRFGQMTADFSLSTGAATLATGRYWSYIRPPAPEAEALDLTGVRPDSLAGRVAVLIGSSRGLGAAVRQALEARGAVVYGLARSASAGDSSRTEVGDAADPEALRRLRKRVLEEHGRLDFLICNACPPILPLRLEPEAAQRIATYINLAVSLTLAPLTEFLELLSQSGGCAVIVSSATVEQPVREWPHYVAAKRAVEALAHAASLQYPRVGTLIVRPPKLLTTLTNTPMGRLGAASPAAIANRIARRLEGPLEEGKTEILG